jgi:chemotaxis protein MotB
MERYGTGGVDQVNGVEVVQTAEGVAFRVAGGVLFAPGQNVLSDGGRRTLDGLLGSLEGRTIRVEGHTDDTPIVRSRWGTNLRLSVERAMSVADHLVKSGLPKERVSAAGYGPSRPAVAGTSDDARKKNRRVEILMIDR